MVSPQTSPFRFAVQAHDDHVRVTAPDIQVSLRNPTAMLEDSMMSVKSLNALLCPYPEQYVH